MTCPCPSHLLHDVQCDALHLDVHLEGTDALSTASNLWPGSSQAKATGQGLANCCLLSSTSSSSDCTLSCVSKCSSYINL